MPFDVSRARPFLQNGDFCRLFIEELGWEPCRRKLTLPAGDLDFAFTAIAEKRGFTAWVCESPDGSLPDHVTRLKLDRALTQTSFEHLIVFITADLDRQLWMWVRRETGKPLSARTHEFTRGQPGDSLLQKLQILFVSLEEEEAGLSVTQVAGRARAAFDIESVTKAFYRDFDTQRKAFLKFIDGIEEVADREWYASVMLNRLMFVYFIQRKGFLDGDPDYRRNRCEENHRKLAAGDVAGINDLITLNLDIRQFAQDAIANCEGPDLLRAFWHAIEKVTILDPTCGSGAFLFAALNILEPLYEACLDRMETLLREETDRVEPALPPLFAGG